ncbi:hypothetical protein LUR56_16495 [Streptomyces sp. MT29]|nr:hypothetical protein [Streptomyces sp. MT29]
MTVSGSAELARRTGTDPSLLGALLDYLVAIGLLEADGEGHRLTPVSEELVEDDHSGAYHWASVSTLTAGGHGVDTLVNALVKAHPALRVRIAALPSELRVLDEQILDTDVSPNV